jgi:hypothetical protein
VRIARATLLSRFGVPHPTLGTMVPTEGELVWFGSGKSGLLIQEDLLTPRRRHFYVEIDGAGNVLRQTLLATFGEEAYLRFLGTEAGQGFAWFSIERYDPPSPPPAGQQPTHTHARGPKELALLRLDLLTLATREVAKVALPARPLVTMYEDRVHVFPSDDFTRFALVEYDELQIQLPPPAASVFVVDASTGTSFAVPAMKTTYGAAFSRDGKHLFLGSAELGTVARVDLAAQRIDKTASGPQLTHDFVISPSGKNLFILGSQTDYGVCDLPDLVHCRTAAHAPGLARAMSQHFGAGVASLDGRFFVLEDALPPGPSVTRGLGPPVKMVVGRFVE